MAKNIQEIEKKLWTTADILRGNLSAEEYMHVLLGILSLKYITDRNKVGIKKMTDDGLKLSDIDSPGQFFDIYNAFFVSEKSSWEHIMKFSNSSEIGSVLDEAFIKLEEDNPILNGIFNKSYNREEIDQKKLGDVVKIFSDEDFTESEDEDIIGRIYEYFLGHFFKDRGQKGGEFYTPTSIVKLMVAVLKPIKGNIYDPACGSGGILVQSKRYLVDHGGDIKRIMVWGQEFNNVTWKLAKLNLLLNGFTLYDNDGNCVLGEKSADTFTNDNFKYKKFEYIMANPPFNMKKWNGESLLDDPRWKWGVPPTGNANYAWLSHMVSKLSENGRAAVVLANGSLSSSQKNELEIRKQLIKENKVDAIIELPDKLFYTTGIPACIWFFNNNKKNENVLMVSSSMIEGCMINKTLRELTEKDIINIVEQFDKHLQGNEVNVIGKAKTITKKDLEENDYSFVPGRYVGTKEEKIDKNKIREDIKILSKDLEILMDEYEKLVPKVKNSIKEVLKNEKK